MSFLQQLCPEDIFGGTLTLPFFVTVVAFHISDSSPEMRGCPCSQATLSSRSECEGIQVRHVTEVGNPCLKAPEKS